MGQAFSAIPEELVRFIGRQALFFVATAPADGRVNLSPKGMDSFRIIGPNEVAYLDLTGSGNETAAHVLENGRITFMFCALSGPPLVLRLYGTARIVHPRDPDWAEWLARFPAQVGTRQIFVAAIDRVSTACGYAVPIYEYQRPRTTLTQWSEKQGREGLEAYWAEKNVESIDGLPTGLLEDA